MNAAVVDARLWKPGRPLLPGIYFVRRRSLANSIADIHTIAYVQKNEQGVLVYACTNQDGVFPVESMFHDVECCGPLMAPGEAVAIKDVDQCLGIAGNLALGLCRAKGKDVRHQMSYAQGYSHCFTFLAGMLG